MTWMIHGENGVVQREVSYADGSVKIVVLDNVESDGMEVNHVLINTTKSTIHAMIGIQNAKKTNLLLHDLFSLYFYALILIDEINSNLQVN
jgi:hypothetical protein